MNITLNQGVQNEKKWICSNFSNKGQLQDLVDCLKYAGISVERVADSSSKKHEILIFENSIVPTAEEEDEEPSFDSDDDIPF